MISETAKDQKLKIYLPSGSTSFSVALKTLDTVGTLIVSSAKELFP